MKKETAYQTLERISKIRLRPDRKVALREACVKQPALSTFIQYTYHPAVKWDLPEGPIPETLRKGSSDHEDYGVFYRNIKKLKNFWVDAPGQRLNKETNFVGLCNDVDVRDSELLVAMKDGKLPWRTLGVTFCVYALPELFPADMAKEEAGEEE